jgi:hypothetical protein
VKAAIAAAIRGMKAGVTISTPFTGLAESQVIADTCFPARQ